MKTKQPKPVYQQFVDRYFSVRQAPTWHEGFLAALGMINYELFVKDRNTEELRAAITQAVEQIQQIEDEE